MIDIQILINNPDFAKKAFEKRGLKIDLIEDIININALRKKGLQEMDTIREQRNQLSKRIHQQKNEQDIQLVKQLKKTLVDLELQQEEYEKQLAKILARIPNFPDLSVPIGENESDNQIIFTSASAQSLKQNLTAHWDIDKNEKYISFEKGVKLSGSRFYVLYDQFAKLQRALIQYLLDTLSSNKFLEVTVPYMVHQECLYAAGQLPKFAENLYRDHLEDYWMIPTAEVPITGLHKDEILDETSLPLYYCAHTPCFRREKASAGKDSRGMKRGHQFDKVEMYSICSPEQEQSVFDHMIEMTKKVCQDLQLPYRLVELCTGDLGFAASKTIDIEVWAAGCNEWLEVSSVSMCKDFQARRAKIRYKKDKKKYLCHTLNGSCLGIPRTMIALLENNLTDKGMIQIPKVLQAYTQFSEINGLKKT